jgi:putative spermidine/putrescine transport system substrate-binding protein
VAAGFAIMGHHLWDEAASAQARRLVVYSYGGPWDEGAKKGPVALLTQKYSNLEVTLDPSGGLNKLIAEKANPQADVSYLDDSDMPIARASGVVEEYDPDKVPNAKFVHPKGKLFGRLGIAMEFGRMGIAYRTDKIHRPTSWRDLWSPDYKGHVGISAPLYTSWIQFLDAAARLNGADVYKNADAGFDMLRKLKPNVLTLTQSVAQETQLITSGDIWIQHWYDGRTLQLKRNGVPVDFVTPKEGAYATITYIAIVKGTKNRDIANDYLNFALTSQAQIAFSEALPYGPTNLEVKLPEDLRTLGVVYGRNALDNLIVIDWEKVAPQRSSWIEKFNQIMKT